MLKYSSFVLLVAVATFWSQVDARIPIRKGLEAAPVGYAVAKRDADEDSSTESEDDIAKELLAVLLLLKTETSAEMDKLQEKYHEAFVRKDWTSLDEFAKYLAKTYQEVTGRRIDDSGESDVILEDSDET